MREMIPGQKCNVQIGKIKNNKVTIQGDIVTYTLSREEIERRYGPVTEITKTHGYFKIHDGQRNKKIDFCKIKKVECKSCRAECENRTNIRRREIGSYGNT